ncbi:MAG: CHAT domain-containing tetratricopeptide repeat protein [Candidatus Krumholzibacteriota bacterium]
MNIVWTRISIFCLVLLFFVPGCGDKKPAWYEGIHDLSNIPLSEDLAPALALSLANLQEPVSAGNIINDYQKFEDLNRRFRPLEARDQAGDEIYALWRAEPENLYWIELAVNGNFLLHRDEELARMSATPVLNDTNTTIGAYFAGRIRYGKTDRGRMYRKAEQGIADLDSLGQIWLTVKLAKVEHLKGNTIAAVRRLMDWLPAARQAGGPSCEARIWRIISDRLSRIDRQNDALYAAAMATALERQGNNRHGELESRMMVTVIRGRQGEVQFAIDKLDSQVEEAERLNHLWLVQWGLDTTAEIAVGVGDYERALPLDRRLLALTFAMGDSINAPRNLVSMAHDFRMMGQLDSNFTYLTRAETIVRQFSDKRNLAKMNEFMAEYHCLVGNYALAESLLVQAKGLSSTGGTENQEGGILLKLIPQALEMGRVDLAYAWFDRLHELENSLYSTGLDQNLRADFHLLSADLLARQGEFLLAAEALAQAEQEVTGSGGEGRRWQLASSQGDLALLRGDNQKAEEAFADCVEIARRGTDPDLVASSHFRLGHLYLETGRFPEARVLFSSADSDSTFGPRYRTRLVSLLLLGITFQREGRNQEALEVLQQGLDQFNPSSPPDLVMRFMLAKGQALAASGELAAAEMILLEVFKMASGIPNPVGFDELMVFRSGVGREAAASLIGLYFDHPELLPEGELGRETLRFTGIFPDRAPSTDDEAPWLVFRVGSNRSWAWVIDKDGPQINSLPGEPELLHLLRPLLSDLSLAGRPTNRSSATQLSEILLGSALRGWHPDRTLTIVSDGLLHDVPWSALPLPDSLVRGSGRLLVDHGPILEYSAPKRPGSTKTDPRDLSLLAIGCNSASDAKGGAGGLPRLRNAEKEAWDIHAGWPSSHKKLRVGKDADWNSIVDGGLADFGIVHLASHAEVYQGLPRRSTLRLYSGDTAAPVTIPAVSRLDLNAELVYLSCCNAARRLSTTGSGVSGFAEAFLAAGARTVIAATHWVDDEASAFMAERFYEHWLAGKSKAEALRAAQQDLRAARAEWNHPSYWAFFRLIGQKS